MKDKVKGKITDALGEREVVVRSRLDRKRIHSSCAGLCGLCQGSTYSTTRAWQS